MLGWLFQTDGGIVPLVLGLSLAVVMFPHGAQKMLGWIRSQHSTTSLSAWGAKAACGG